MNWWLYCTPLIGALAGWLLVSVLLRLLFHPGAARTIAGITIQGLVPARWQSIAAQVGALSASLFSLQELEEKITHPDNVKKIMPHAETHIDNFLRVKLVKSMPVVGMFVGDKTIHNLKALFVTELEELFPEIMKNYMGNLQADLDIAEMVRNKLAAVQPAVVEHAFNAMMAKQLRLIKLLGAVFGLIMGAIQLLVVLLLQ